MFSQVRESEAHESETREAKWRNEYKKTNAFRRAVTAARRRVHSSFIAFYASRRPARNFIAFIGFAVNYCRALQGANRTFYYELQFLHDSRDIYAILCSILSTVKNCQ